MQNTITLCKINKALIPKAFQSRPPYVGNEERPAELELQLKDTDFMNIAAGKLRPDQAFLQGKMKLKGNVGKANRLRTLLKHGTSNSKL
ncbi:hypothetical protein ANCCEY_09272 [Ancylostoma ceylanicum]|uniref:SCP2 domain-containing protein n=2 Tax=Ancylostoma ceylanicum TaxID=53326 RepID=A0A0D6LNL1_9BILA|nr:hypothetical protein ANCCEY_09272 [Ancylostoma ceylanicum]EYC23918.1 hypothetical protein Y032_0014g2213 [Ancylostoma ceylanicum]